MCFQNCDRYKHEKFKNSKEIHNVSLKMFDKCSLSCLANVKATFEFFPYIPLQLLLIDVDYAM